MLIGLHGQKRSGKDTVANYLVEYHRFIKYGLADKVKALLYATDPLVVLLRNDLNLPKFAKTNPKLSMSGLLVDDIGLAEVFGDQDESGSIYRLQYVVDMIGWEQAKEIPEVRQLLQRVGTEGARTLFGKDFWVDALFDELQHLVYENGEPFNMVISDVRFPNEAKRILESGGKVIRLERDGLEEDSHASEQPIPQELITTTITNNSTIEDLKKSVNELILGLEIDRQTGRE